MKPHLCQRADYCICNALADEPSDKCSIHGTGEWPPRCMICGRFMKHSLWTETLVLNSATVEANKTIPIIYKRETPP